MKRTSRVVPLLLLGLLVSLLASCSKQDGTNEPTRPEEGRTSLTFTLQMPQGEPVTYRAAIHDEPEWTVKTLTMYQFTTDDKLVAVDQLDMAKLTKTADAEYSYTKEFAEDQAGKVYRFLFIANDNITGVTVGTTTRADLEAKLMTKQLQANGTSKDILTGTAPDYTIPMSGVAKQGSSELIALTGTNKGTQVILTRAVARIDVANHVPNLTITKLSLLNTYNQTSTFPTSENGELTYKAPTTAQKVAMSAGFAELPNPFNGIAGVDGHQLKKAFYLYEGPQPEDEAQRDEATTIVVEGQLSSGQPVKYLIPFTRTSITYSPVHVKRNYLYKLVLGDNTPLEPGSKLVFTIEDTPWNAVLLNHHMPILDVEIVEHVETSLTKFDYLNHTFYTAHHDDYFFRLSNRFKDHTAYTVKPLNADAQKMDFVLMADSKGELRRLRVTTWDKNNPSDMTTLTAQYEITSDADPTLKRILTVVFDNNYTNPDRK